MIPGPSRALIERYNLAFCAGAIAAAFALGSPLFAASVVLGALVATANLRAIWHYSEIVLGLAADDGRRLPKLGFGVRFILMGAVLWVALSSGANAIGLLIGLSMMVPAVVIAAWRNRPALVQDLPALAPDDPEWDIWNPWLARERDPDEDDE